LTTSQEEEEELLLSDEEAEASNAEWGTGDRSLHIQRGRIRMGGEHT